MNLMIYISHYFPGWGRTSNPDGPLAKKLRQVNLPVMSKDECKKIMRYVSAYAVQCIFMDKKMFFSFVLLALFCFFSFIIFISVKYHCSEIPIIITLLRGKKL